MPNVAMNELTWNFTDKMPLMSPNSPPAMIITGMTTPAPAPAPASAAPSVIQKEIIYPRERSNSLSISMEIAPNAIHPTVTWPMSMLDQFCTVRNVGESMLNSTQSATNRNTR